ncbi:MAG: TolC family protein [Emcibacteraceae bacterium]
MDKKHWGLRLVILLLSLIMPLVIQAQEHNENDEIPFDGNPTYSQTFKENISSAVATHPRIAAAIAQRDEQRYVEDEARAGLYPHLEVGLTGRHRLADNFEDRFDNITQRSLRDTAANVTVTGRQLLYDGGSTSSKIASAKYAFSAAHEEYSMEASGVALAAIETHYTVLLQRMRKAYHQENVDRHREILDMVNERFKSGRGPNRDVTLMESRLAIAETEQSRVQMDLEEAISNYVEVYNFAPENLKRPALVLNIPTTENEALEIGFQNNPMLVMASSQSLSSKEYMNSIRAERLPSVSVELAATKYDLERGNPDYDVTGRVVINYSLYNGGASSARISRSLKSYERTRHSEDNINREVNRNIKVAYQSMESQARQVISLQKAMEASRINRDQTREQFEVTGGSLFNLLEAEKEHQNAKEQHLAGVIDYDIAQFRLLDAMGTLLPALNILINKVGDE